MNTTKQANKGDIVLYENLTFQSCYYGVVVGRNKEDNGYEVVRLDKQNRPFILTNGGVDFDTAFDSNLREIYTEGKYETGKKLY